VTGRALIVCLTAFLGACKNLPEAYAPPEQRQIIPEDRPYRLNRVIDMDDAAAPSRFVRDISRMLAANWRWTGQRPAIDIFMRANDGVRFVIDFALPEVNFKTTGPVTLSFYVNNHLLDTVRYSQAGLKHFEKPVPPEWIPAGHESTVSAEIDKLSTDPADGSKLGFILVRMGMTQQ
jgi:hypothetical protein